MTGPIGTTARQPEGFRQMRFTPPPGATTLLLIRHGESAAADPDRPFPLHEGHGNPPLHDHGHEQARHLADRLHTERIDAIYVTTLQRTQQTAAPLAERLGLTPTVVAELREVHLGEWEGGTLRRKVAEGDPLIGELFRRQRWDVIPGAEPEEAFGARLAAGIARIVAAHPDGRVAVVVHGGVIGRILADATGTHGFAFAGADNASISELVVMADGRQVMRRFNDTAHLGPA